MSPYGYDASPNELWFALFKRGNVNAANKPTGRKAYKDVIRMILDQASTISRGVVVKLWHKAVIGLFNYLSFKPL